MTKQKPPHIADADSYTNDPYRRADYIAGWYAGFRSATRAERIEGIIERAHAAVAPIIEHEQRSEIVGSDVLDREIS